MRKLIFALALFTGGCMTVRQDDLDAWAGAPLIDLETHPFFASIQPEIRPLSDGSKLYIYFNGGTGATSLGDTVFANKRGCSNQFLVKNGAIVRYTPVGVGGMRCMTNCSLRPASRPC